MLYSLVVDVVLRQKSVPSARWLTAGALMASLALLATGVFQQSTTAQEAAAAVRPAQATGTQDAVKDWNQWRGPNRTGLIDGLNWPDSLDESTLVKKWSVKLGPSYSGTIVVGDKVFTTETVDRTYERVHCFDRESGSEIWKQQWKGAMSVPFFAKANGDWIRATPVYDEGRLFVAGMRDVLVCLDAQTGDVIWKVDFPATTKSSVPSFGMVCSPMIDGPFLYVQAGGGFCKLKKDSGSIVWNSLRDGGGMNGSAFASPIIATVSGKRQALVQTRTELCGVDLDSGQKLWAQTIPSFRGMNIITPTLYKQDNLFVSTYGGTTQLINVSGSNESFTPKQSWSIKSQGYMTTPVVIGDYAYTHLRNQRFACYDLKNGTEVWKSRPHGKYASLIGSGDKILALDQKGVLMLIKATPDAFTVLDERTVGNDSWAHLAVRGNQVFVRNLDELVVFEFKSK